MMNMKNEIVVDQQNTLALNDMEDVIKKFLNYIDVSKATFETYSRALKQFCEYLYSNGINSPKRDDILAYKKHLMNTVKPKTVNLYISAVKNLFKWLEYEEIAKDITRNIKGITLDTVHIKRGLTREELSNVMKVCSNDREKLIIELALTCALRVNELCNIQIKDFYLDRGTYMLKILGKGRNELKQDSVKIDDKVMEHIQKYVKDNSIIDYLFVSNSNRGRGKKITSTSLRRIINKLFDKAGINDDRVSPHSLRHSSCEIALENGTPIHEVSEFMRHMQLSTTMVYSKELDRRKCQISNVLTNVIFN